MKKSMLIITILFLIAAIGFFSYTLYLNNNSKNNLTKLKENIKENEEFIKQENKNKEQLEKEYKELSKEVKEEVSEYNLWLKVKEKITN